MADTENSDNSAHVHSIQNQVPMSHMHCISPGPKNVHTSLDVQTMDGHLQYPPPWIQELFGQIQIINNRMDEINSRLNCLGLSEQ